MNNTKIIFTLRMAGYLMQQGNPLIHLRDDNKDRSRKVFIFMDTEKLRKDIVNYSN